jgi:hypothetical protein
MNLGGEGFHSHKIHRSHERITQMKDYYSV